MHELGITQGIIDRARAAAQEGGGVRVERLHLSITPAADFSQESIEMYFEMLTADDPFFSGAELAFEWSPVAATCLACGKVFETETRGAACPACGCDQVSYDPSAPMIQLVGIDVAEESDSGEADDGAGDDGDV